LTGQTDNRTNETYCRRLTAFHESGHIVATVMCGGSFSSIGIEPDGDRDGFTSVHVPARDMAFVVFAGPWAEARCEWARPLDGEDDDGSTFDDCLGRAFERNAAGDLREYRRLSLADAAVYRDANAQLMHASEQRWSRKLEAKWSVIQRVAELLICGSDVTAEMVVELLGGWLCRDPER
jgi:hypothetical protein